MAIGLQKELKYSLALSRLALAVSAAVAGRAAARLVDEDVGGL